MAKDDTAAGAGQNPDTSAADDKSADGARTGTAGANAKYSDEDMDRMRIRLSKKAERDAKRAAQAAIAEVLEAAGVGDLDELVELTERVTAGKSAEEGASTELRKMQRQIAKLTGERDQIAEQFGSLKRKIDHGNIREAVRAAAKKVDAYEDEVWALLQVAGRVGVDEDGSVVVRSLSGEIENGKTVDALVAETVKDRKHLQRATPTVGAGSQGAGNSSPKTDVTTREGQIATLMRAYPEGPFGGSR